MLKQALKGLTNKNLAQGIFPQHAPVQFTQQQVCQIIEYFRGKKMWSFANVTMLAWECLLRVQSEGLVVYKGSPSDATNMVGRPNGHWQDSAGNHCYRLAQRKHRKHGSLLMRTCRCAEVPQAYCGVCQLTQSLSAFVVGEQMWSMDENDFLRQIKRAMVLLGIPGSDRVGLKAFRSGRATSLLSQNKALGTILKMGEWRSKAVVNHANVDEVNCNAFLNMQFEESDEEDIIRVHPKGQAKGWVRKQEVKLRSQQSGRSLAPKKSEVDNADVQLPATMGRKHKAGADDSDTDNSTSHSTEGG